MSRKNIFLLIIFLLIIAALGASVYYYFLKAEINTKPAQLAAKTTENQEKEIKHPPCLADNEYADYLRRGTGSSAPSLPFTILIKDKETKNEKYGFEIPDVRPSEIGYYMFKCGFYVVKIFAPNSKTELWHYNYNNEGKKLLDLFSVDEHNFFIPDFRIDSTETYIALIRSWYGEPENHALVVKDLKTMEDVRTVTLKAILEQFPDIEPATIALDGITDKEISFHLLNTERNYFAVDVKTGELIPY